MISDVEAAHILIAMSRSKPRVVVKAIEKESTLPVQVPKHKRSSLRVPRNMRRSFPMDPSCSSSTAIVEYVSQEDASPPRMSSLSRTKLPRASCSTAEYVSQEDASPPRTPPLSRKKRPRASCSTALVEYVSEEDASPPPRRLSLSRKKRPPIAKQPKKKAKVAASSWTLEPTPEWLLKLVEGEEEDPKRIIEKVLSAIDVSRGHNRLSMPFSNIIDLGFLSLAEQGLIDRDEGKKSKTGVNAKLVVKFVDSDVLMEFEMNLRRWSMPKKSGSHTFVYNLVTGWNKVAGDCGLRENHRIRVWSYHSDGKLCFALDLATPAPPGHPLHLLPPPPPSDSGDATPEEMSFALVVYDKSYDDLQPK